ncbi:DNA replication protein, putative [Streptococcus pseudoporcinus]|uniref:DNA replication protein, putative n=1 Tax=Streptococcus pseudoporcinus TaxID=361101 RepID=A0A4U9XMV5_9STRE|nr:DnaD domain protein [Streptococcus pseudoporcinus]VTS14008.1 DNA replication protein, putative [Streptococcus pseudoporcinus]
MAQKRMFSKKITDSDKFLDLPLTAQALYFHLNMHADDDGFVDSTKTIKRMIGASDGDLRVLLEQAFVIPFESGVIVIKDWKIHNYIPKDRYQKTVYTTEFSKLGQEENKSYTDCIQNVYNMDTQIRLDKNKLDKNKLDKKNVEERSANNQLTEISNYFQQEIGVLTPNQFEQLSQYITEDTFEIEVIKRAIDKSANSAKRSFGYVNGILRGWRQNGITTIVQVEAEQRDFENKKQDKFQNKAISNIPAWSNPNYQQPDYDSFKVDPNEVKDEPGAF